MNGKRLMTTAFRYEKLKKLIPIKRLFLDRNEIYNLYNIVCSRNNELFFLFYISFISQE
jgi:fructosamine-3-kinase